MRVHPINLVFRFILELVALVSFALWGWQQVDGWLRFILVLGLPILLASAWGIFAVPGDPSRSGKAPIPIKGWLRLALELGFFSFAIWCLYDIGHIGMGSLLGIAVLFHYIIANKRIFWLLKNN